MTKNDLNYEITLGYQTGNPTATARIYHRGSRCLMIDKTIEGEYHDDAYDLAEEWAQGWIADYHDDAADAAYEQRVLRRHHDDYPEYPGA